jgi:hypothetical protein
MARVVFFFGAGASAAFGIPTMQEMVQQFEKTLQRDEKTKERELYQTIRGFLETTLGRPVDLEAVFTIVDSIINWSVDRIGIASLYHAMRASARDAIPVLRPPTEETVDVARALEMDFEKFVQDACQIPDGQSATIDAVYRAFFDNIGTGLGGGQVIQGQSGRQHILAGPIFTTNYDAVLEHYWLDKVKAPLNTGFAYDSVAGMLVSGPDSLRQNDLRLFKLHGSITWYLDDSGRLTEQRVAPEKMRTVTGRPFLGQVMLYPIEVKDLFVEPYQTMYLMLNRELQAARNWIVVGYSFGDRIIRDIFIQNSRADKQTNLFLVHPHASKIAQRLVGFAGSVSPLDARFSGGEISRVSEAVREHLQRHP